MRVPANMDNDEDDTKPILCFCQGMCPYGLEYGTCQTQLGGKCFTSVELDIGDDGNEHPVLSYGCLPPHEMALFQCQSTLIATSDTKNIKCCDEYDLCNKHLLPIVEKPIHPEIDYFHGLTVNVLISSIAVCLVFIVAGLTLTYLKFKREIRLKNRVKEDDVNLTTLAGDINSHDEDSDIRVSSKDISSDAKVELVERTISKQITFEDIIATGQYSKVWTARWRGEKVAVKVYKQHNEQAWMREIEIFHTPLLRHEHILGYIAADIKECRPKSKMYIITDYHDYGSLRDYLTNHTVDPMELLQMTKGLASGLNHLHNEIIGSNRKPCIAHNNINSTNILITNEKECCFGGFSKAVRFFSTQNRMDAPQKTENDEFRYLAPEFLENSFSPNTIETFKMGDVYSLALIIWEILNRCETSSSYLLPYEEELAAENCEHSLENVTKLVAIEKVRPKLSIQWQENQILKIIATVMVECWNTTPSVRLTCLRVKKTLFKLQGENYE